MITLMIVIGVLVGLSLVGTVIAVAMGLIGALVGVLVPAALLGGFGYFVYYMFKRGMDSTRDKRTKAEPLDETETEVMDDFNSFYNQSSFTNDSKK